MKKMIAMKDNIYIYSFIDVRARSYGLMAVHFFEISMLFIGMLLLLFSYTILNKMMMGLYREVLNC